MLADQSSLIRWFSARSLRERFLLGGILWVSTLLGVNFFLGTWGDLQARHERALDEQTYQESVLERDESIADRLLEGLQVFDKEKTLDRSRFLETVEKIARSTGGKFRTESAQNRDREVFEEFSVALKLENLDIGGLVNFLKAVDEQRPYLGMDALQIVPDRRNPSNLRIESKIVAIRLKDEN